MSRSSVVLFACVLLSACDGGSGSRVDSGAEDVLAGQVLVRGDGGLDRGPDGYRLSTVRYGVEDGDFVGRIFYDEDGRVAVERYEDRGEIRNIVVYEHEGGRLRRKIDDDDIVDYRRVDGRLWRIEGGDGDNLDYREYRYDDAGRLSGLTASVDEDPGAPSRETAIDVLEYAFAYRDGRLATVTESEPGGEGRFVTRYAYDEDGLLASETSSFDDFVSIWTRTALTRDENRRLTTVSETRSSGAVTDTTFTHDGDRLISIRTEARTPFGDGNGVRTRQFAYSDVGTIERVTGTFVDTDTGTTSTRIDLFEYEEEPCVGQASARPELMLVGELLGVRRPVSAALDCGYWFEQSR